MVALAYDLLGKEWHTDIGGEHVSGYIREAEAYAGEDAQRLYRFVWT